MSSKTKNKPLVSVHICNYNRANKISKAIDSVLDQNYQNLQILIMDDASDDNTSEIIEPYLQKDSRVEYYKNTTNLGISKNRNKALSLSKGKYVAVLDSDDYWINNDKLNLQVDFLENNSNHGVVGTYTKFVDNHEKELFIFKPNLIDSAIRKNILMKNQFVHSSVLFRKNILNTYNEQEIFKAKEDYVAWLEIGKKHKLANLPIITTLYLQHESNSSKENLVTYIKNLGIIIKNYKNDYPNYLKASLKNQIRLVKAILGFK